MELDDIDCVVNRVRTSVSLDRFEYQRVLSQALQPVLESKIRGESQQPIIPDGFVNLFLESGLPEEALNFVSELCKSAGDTESRKYKIAKCLVALWFKRSSCAEAFVRFSLSPTSTAQSGNFCRQLFAAAENFHTYRQDFPRIVTDQILLAILCLAKLAQTSESLEIQTALLSSVLDRLFLRYHTDEENFYLYFDSEDRLTPDLKGSEAFLQFTVRGIDLVKDDFITRKILSKILLGVGRNTATKFARLLLIVLAATGSNDVVLHPPEDFVRNNGTWKYVFVSAIPFKTRVENLPFFFSWAKFLVSAYSPEEMLAVWADVSDMWCRLIVSPALDSKSMASSTCSIVALAKAMRQCEGQLTSTRDQLQSRSVSSIFEGAQKCLESTDVLKQACGMAVLQVTSDLFGMSSTNSESNDRCSAGSAQADDRNKLKFDSQNPFFIKCTSFYESQEPVQQIQPSKLVIRPRQFYADIGELDSDDEENPEEHPGGEDSVEDNGFQAYDMSGDSRLDDALMGSNSSRKQIPNYLSEVCEILTEGQGTKDEAAQEKLKQIAVLKLPVLLEKRVQMDRCVSERLARVLAETQGGTLLEIPIICGLFELAKLFPNEVFSTVSQVAFDKDHHSAGHRMVVAARITEVTQLLSDQKCFACFSESTGKLMKVLEGIHAPFVNEYLRVKQSLRKCAACMKSDRSEKPGAVSPEVLVPPEESSFTDSNRMLTWREVIEKRVAAKTRRFASARSPGTPKIDTYSAHLVPVIWASIANKLMEEYTTLQNPKSVENLSNSLFTAQVLRTLGIIVLGVSGIFCPHLRNIATQTADLVMLYSYSSDAQVRRAALSLLGIVISKSEGHGFVLDVFNGVFDKLNPIFERDPDTENRQLFEQLMKLVTVSSVVQLSQFLAE